MTNRTQYGVPSALASVTNAAAVQFTADRPRTLPVETNTVDFVARGYTRQEFEGGLAAITLNAKLADADHAVRAVEILDWDGAVARTVLSTTGNAYLGNGAQTTALLSRLLISEDEAGVRLSVIKVTAGTTTLCGFVANFDFGLNNANYGSTA